MSAINKAAINALVTESGVNMGDHAQDVTRAVVLHPDMTVREVCEKFLTKKNWIGIEEGARVEPDDQKFIIIRLAVPEAEAAK